MLHARWTKVAVAIVAIVALAIAIVPSVTSSTKSHSTKQATLLSFPDPKGAPAQAAAALHVGGRSIPVHRLTKPTGRSSSRTTRPSHSAAVAADKALVFASPAVKTRTGPASIPPGYGHNMGIRPGLVIEPNSAVPPSKLHAVKSVPPKRPTKSAQASSYVTHQPVRLTSYVTHAQLTSSTNPVTCTSGTAQANMFSMAYQSALPDGDLSGCVVPQGVDPTISYVPGSFGSLTVDTCKDTTAFYSPAPVYGSAGFTHTGTGTATLNETSGCYVVWIGTLSAGTGTVLWFTPQVTITCASYTSQITSVSGTYTYSDPSIAVGGSNYPGCLGSGPASVTFSASGSTTDTTGIWLPDYPGTVNLAEAACGSTTLGSSVDSLQSLAVYSSSGQTQPSAPTSATYAGTGTVTGSTTLYPGINPTDSASTAPPNCYSFVVTTEVTQSTPLVVWTPPPPSIGCTPGCFQSTFGSSPVSATVSESHYLPSSASIEYFVTAQECNSSAVSAVGTLGPYGSNQTFPLSTFVSTGQTCANVIVTAGTWSSSSGWTNTGQQFATAQLNAPIVSCTPSMSVSGSDGVCDTGGAALSSFSLSITDSNSADLLTWQPCGGGVAYDVPLSTLPSPYTLTGSSLPVLEGCTSYEVIPSASFSGPNMSIWIGLPGLQLNCQANTAYPFNSATTTQFTAGAALGQVPLQGCYAPDSLWPGSTNYPVQLSVQSSLAWQISEWPTTTGCTMTPPSSATQVAGSGTAASDIAFTPSGPTTMCFQLSSGSPAVAASPVVEVQYLPDYTESSSAAWQWATQNPFLIDAAPITSPAFGQQLCTSVIANGTTCDPGVTQATSGAKVVSCPSGVPAPPTGDVVTCFAQVFQGQVSGLGAGNGSPTALGPTTDTNPADATFNQPQSTTVTWYEFAPPASITLVASPTSLPVGNPTTLTATASSPPGTSCSVAFSSQSSSTGSFPSIGNVGTDTTTSTTQTTWSFSTTSSTAQTLYFQSELVCAGSVVASSAPVPVTWTAAPAAPPPAYPT